MRQLRGRGRFQARPEAGTRQLTRLCSVEILRSQQSNGTSTRAVLMGQLSQKTRWALSRWDGAFGPGYADSRRLTVRAGSLGQERRGTDTLGIVAGRFGGAT
jgi:hypothetical protein